MNIKQLDKGFRTFAAENIQIRPKNVTSGYVPFHFNPVQEHRWQTQIKSKRRRFIDMKSRQHGITTYHVAKNLMRCLFIEGYSVLFISHRDDHAEYVRQMVKSMYDRLPAPLRRATPRLISKGDPLMWAHGAVFAVGSARRFDFGRGTTVHSLHCSEYAAWPDPRAQFAAVLPAVPLDGEIVVESTTAGFGPFYDLCIEARNNPKSAWEFSFYEWFRDPTNQLAAPEDFTPELDELPLIEQHGLTPEQLTFRRLMKRDHPGEYLQEYAEDFDTAFLAAGDSKFTVEQITRMREGCRDPLTIAKPPIYLPHTDLLRIWQPPFDGAAYVIGADTAEGVPNGDYSAAVVLRSNGSGGTHVATLMDAPPFRESRERRFSPDAYAKSLNDLGRYYNNALIIVELPGPGDGVLKLLENLYKYPNLYRHDGHHWGEGAGDRAGFRQTDQTKSALVADVSRKIDSLDLLTYDIRVPQNMADFIVKERTGAGYEKLAARPGSHDDLMMALLLAAHGAPQAMYTQSRPSIFTRIW